MGESHTMTTNELLDTWRETLMEMSSKKFDSIANPLITLIDAHKELQAQALRQSARITVLEERLNQALLFLKCAAQDSSFDGPPRQ